MASIEAADTLDQRGESLLSRNVFLLTVLLNLFLIVAGWMLVPTASVTSIAGITLILLIYGLVGFFVFPRIQSRLIRLVTVFGFIAGVIFAGEILLEYALLPKDNTSWGLTEFGAVFVVFMVSGAWAAYGSQSIKDGIITAILSAMLGSLIWLFFVLVTFYLFRGTLRQELVFTAEGNFEDFARSGMKDFNTFVMEDFFGAGFFHLLLVPLFAAFWGAVGSAFGKGIAKLRKH